MRDAVPFSAKSIFISAIYKSLQLGLNTAASIGTQSPQRRLQALDTIPKCIFG
jgi:hypothetical protein